MHSALRQQHNRLTTGQQANAHSATVADNTRRIAGFEVDSSMWSDVYNVYDRYSLLGSTSSHTLWLGADGAYMCSCGLLPIQGLPCEHYLAFLATTNSMQHFCCTSIHGRWLHSDLSTAASTKAAVNSDDNQSQSSCRDRSVHTLSLKHISHNVPYQFCCCT
jgi:hypothetical protein